MRTGSVARNNRPGPFDRPLQTAGAAAEVYQRPLAMRLDTERYPFLVAVRTVTVRGRRFRHRAHLSKEKQAMRIDEGQAITAPQVFASPKVDTVGSNEAGRARFSAPIGRLADCNNILIIF